MRSFRGRHFSKKNPKILKKIENLEKSENLEKTENLEKIRKILKKFKNVKKPPARSKITRAFADVIKNCMRQMSKGKFPKKIDAGWGLIL